RLAREPGTAEPQPGADAGRTPRPGGSLSHNPPEDHLRPLLGGCPPRPHRRLRACGGGALLVETVEERPRRGALLASQNSLYFSLQLKIHPRPSFVIDISGTIEGKMQAIGCYESQFVTGRPRESPTPLEDVRDRARYWGWSIGTRYGEPFASREELGLKGL